MLRSIRHKRNADIRFGVAVLFAAVMALRVLAAPAVMAAAPDGTVVLCSGASAITITLDGSEPSAKVETQPPCPLFGFHGATPPPPADCAEAPPAENVETTLPADTPLVAQKRDFRHAPRAPPAAAI